MSWRISSAPGAPPGSRVRTVSIPADLRALTSRATWVDLPLPSPPSKVMKRPRASAITPFCLTASVLAAEDEVAERRADAAHRAQALDIGGGDKRELGRGHAGRRDDE